VLTYTEDEEGTPLYTWLGFYADGSNVYDEPSSPSRGNRDAIQRRDVHLYHHKRNYSLYGHGHTTAAVPELSPLQALDDPQDASENTTLERLLRWQILEERDPVPNRKFAGSDDYTMGNCFNKPEGTGGQGITYKADTYPSVGD
jgi:hypothetical protein